MRCIVEGTLVDEELKREILREIRMVIRHTDDFTFRNLHRMLARLLLTPYDSDIRKILVDNCTDHPISVLNVLYWFESDLLKFKDIIKICYDSLIKSDPLLITHFLRHRLRKKDKVAIDLAKETLLLSDYNTSWMDRSNVTEFDVKIPLLSPLVMNAVENNEVRQLLIDIMTHTKNKNSKLIEIMATYLFIVNGRLYYDLRNTIGKYDDLRNIIEDYKEVQEELTSSSFAFEKLIDNILKEMRDKPNFCPTGCKIIKKFVSSLGTNGSIKLMNIAMDLVDKQDEYCYSIIELLQSYAKTGKVGIIGPISELLKNQPKLIRTRSPQVKKQRAQSSSIHSISEIYRMFHQDLSFMFQPTIEYKKDESWPARDTKKLTENQKQILSLIDCATELNPEVGERPDVLEYLDPNSFDNLRPLIENKSQFFLFRRSALDLYIGKLGEQSTEYVLSLVHDDDLLPVILPFLLRVGEIERVEEIIINRKLPTELKKSVLLDMLRSKQDIASS